ncbi:hypothetical protein [Nonomuraea sp. JJY05]|uniref:hypothetical protein n=1 Tax=Nonomuraea sp. JJY05 TaxID=3350255 RepID=UPI00373EBC36
MDHAFSRRAVLTTTTPRGTRSSNAFVNRQYRTSFNDRGAATHYFKCGIYGRTDMSARSDNHIKNIHIYRK